MDTLKRYTELIDKWLESKGLSKLTEHQKMVIAREMDRVIVSCKQDGESAFILPLLLTFQIVFVVFETHAELKQLDSDQRQQAYRAFARTHKELLIKQK